MTFIIVMAMTAGLVFSGLIIEPESELTEKEISFIYDEIIPAQEMERDRRELR